jgi:putative oxidoreductase
MFSKLMKGYLLALKGLEFLRPGFELGIRLYLAWVFFASALTKIQSWQTTLTLFEYEYAVPLLSPYAAALLGTVAELVLPVFIALGLGSRFAAIALFIFNAVAVVSYPDLSPAGYQQHLLWGFMITVLFFYGPGKLSLDQIVAGYFCRKNAIH